MRFIGIIPARFASTRFPGKPLVDVDGKSMIRRVYERAASAAILNHVVVATDDQRIYDHVIQFGKVVLTSSEHPSGTDRCCEVAEGMFVRSEISETDVIVNIQGDEPYIDPGQITDLCNCFQNDEVGIATLVKKIEDTERLFDENTVKVVFDTNRKALYFSRSPIPFQRGTSKDSWLKNYEYFKHIGMYAYRFNVLKEITSIKPSSYEKAEALEQLRWIQWGYSVYVAQTQTESFSVDTPQDLARITGTKTN